MNKQERTEALERVLDDLSGWDWADSFEMTQEEGEAILFLLKAWDERRKYLHRHYANDRENRIAESKQRYWEKKRRLCCG